jgi:membrane associated rhomboid family serine protease
MASTRAPLLTILLACLIVLVSSLSLNQIFDGRTLYLSSRILQGDSLWSPLTYWMVVDQTPSLILALLPLFLFGTSVEKLAGRTRLLLLFFAGVIFAALVFALGFQDKVGQVLAANGALCGGAALCGAAFIFSLTGRIESQSSQLPMWLLCLLFMAGIVWTSLFVQEAIYENVAFRSIGFLVGAVLSLFFLRKIPRPEGT